METRRRRVAIREFTINRGYREANQAMSSVRRHSTYCEGVRIYRDLSCAVYLG